MHMYLFNEILFTLPFVVYAGVRVAFLIRRPAMRALFAAAFLLFLAGYPVAETLSHGERYGAADAVIWAGYCALPLLMYFLVTVVGADLVVGGLRLSGALSRERARRPGFARARLAFCLGVPALVVGLGVANNAIVRVKRYAIDVPRGASALRALRVVFASDFHLQDRTPDGFMDRFVARVNALRPDVVLIGGDVLEGDRREAKSALFEAAFQRLRTTYGVYAAPGNHETYRGGAGPFFDRAGIRLLEDEVVRVDGAFTLAGRKCAGHRSSSRRSVGQLLEGVPRDLPILLVDHMPTEPEAARRAGVAAQFSGHTHMGQLFPVSILTARIYELAWGHSFKGGMHLFVTSGLGIWGPPVRTAGRSEIVCIDVRLR